MVQNNLSEKSFFLNEIWMSVRENHQHKFLARIFQIYLVSAEEKTKSLQRKYWSQEDK